MNYDDRIMNTGLILSCFNTEFAEKNGYKDKSGYFTDVINNYADLTKCYYGKLTGINKIGYQLDSDRWYTFFLPEGAVKPKPKEKIYRPYNLVEFMDQFTIGRPVHFRRKDTIECCYYLAFLGYWDKYCGDEIVTYISLGSNHFSLDTLFNEYEWQYETCDEWKPFGIEVR